MKTLFLAWQDPKSRSWFPIGRLTFDGKKYQFVYTLGATKAHAKCGFRPLFSFPDINKVYTSVELFPLFSNRLMRRSRPEYKNYVEWLNIPQNEDDPIAILARSGGRKATDTFEVFPHPQLDENGLYHIHFFAHGLRHIPECAIERINDLKTGDILYLANEFQNPYDGREANRLRHRRALILCTRDHYIVGYCPRYLVDDALEMLRQNPDLVHIHVERVNPAPTPLQLRLLCNMTAKWHTEFRPFSSEEYQSIVETKSGEDFPPALLPS